MHPKREIGRNAPCRCGSGKEYKNCHLDADRRAESKPSEVLRGHDIFEVKESILALEQVRSKDVGPHD